MFFYKTWSGNNDDDDYDDSNNNDNNNNNNNFVFILVNLCNREAGFLSRHGTTCFFVTISSRLSVS